MNVTRISFWELVMPLVYVVLIWAATMAGWFALPQGMLYDAAVRLTPPGGDAGQELLIVEADLRNNDGADWAGALEILQKNEAAQILFLFMPEDATPAFYEGVAAMDNVRFGRRVVPGEEPVLEPVPAAGRGIPFRTGVLAHPVSTYGMHREHQSLIRVEGHLLPSLAREAAGFVHGPEYIPLQDRFLVNFVDRPALLPKVSLKQLLAEELVPEMIRGRTVVVGFGHDPAYPGLQTPLNPNRESMSILDFEGYVLDTLLRGGIIVRPEGVEVPVALAILGVAALFVFLQLPLVLGLGAGVLMLVAVGAGAWAVVFFFNLWLPLVQAWSVIVLMFLQVIIFRNIRQDRVLRRMLLERSGRLHKVLVPSESEDSSVSWDGIMNMVDQSLNVNRSIFLERIPGQNRVREIAALRCSINDIQERRRDIGRSPYTTALEEGGPVRLTDRQVLASGPEAGVQYLVPLRHAGYTLGFWALDIRDGAMRSQPELVGLIRDFSREIGELLARHREGKAKKDQALLHRLAGGGKRGGGLVRINRDLHMLEKRLLLLDGVFQSMGTATILYDMFGRVVQINEGMAELLRQADLAPFAMSGLDLAAKLSGRPLEEVRALLADSIVSKGTHTLIVSLPAFEKKSLLLSFRALGRDRSEEQEENSPFSVHGILFEVVNASAVRDAEEIRKRFVEEAVFYLQQGVESLQDACTLIESDERSASRLPEVQARKENLDALLERFQRLAGTDMLDSVTGQSPADPVAILNRVWEGVADDAGARKITLDSPDREGELVMTTPGGLEVCLRSVFAYLLADSVQGSRIVVQLRESDQATVLDILGTGFGMPGEEFDRMFNDPNLPVSPELARVREAAAQAAQWETVLTGSSELGRGTAFRLRMPRFKPFAAKGVSA